MCIILWNNTVGIYHDVNGVVFYFTGTQGQMYIESTKKVQYKE